MMLRKNPIKSNLLIFAICLMAFIFNGDYLAVNLAINSIAKEFHSDLSTIQWILGGYMLAWALLVIPAGKLLDYYSTKNIAVISISLFLLASVGGGLSVNASTIILSRFLQGASAAIFVPTIYSIVFRHFAAEQQGKVMGLICLAVGAGLALGPMLGGFFIAYYGWRSIFFVNLPIGLVTILIIIYSEKKENVLNQNPQKICKKSVLLLTASIVSLLLAIGNQDVISKVINQQFLALFSLFSFIVFIVLQKKSKNPLISPDLFASKSFLSCCIGIFIMEYAFSSILIVATLYLQNCLQISVYNSSYIFLWISLIFGLMAAVGGRWADKSEIRIPIASGFIIFALAAYSFSYFAANENLSAVNFLLLIMGLGSGLSYASLNTGILKTVPANEVGIGTGIFLTITLLGNVLGVTIAANTFESHKTVTSLFAIMHNTGLLSLIGAIICFNCMKVKYFPKPITV